MGKTSIEWCDHSINPLRARNIETGAVGHFCAKISPGCKFCYASKQQNPYLTQLEYIAENRPKVELFLEQKALDQVLRRRKPTSYFWCDMTDMFMGDYPDEWIDQCFATMSLTPWHTHMVLTKRADRLIEYFCEGRHTEWWLRHGHQARRRIQDILAPTGNRTSPAAASLFDNWPLANVRIGVSVEDRARKDRIDLLRQTPAAVRFLSLEPLLEDLGELDLTGIHWVITGGESGPNARPAHPDWFRSIRDQCIAAGVAYFHKQNGEYAEWASLPGQPTPADSDILMSRNGRIMTPVDSHRVRDEFINCGYTYLRRVGKKAAGALLDGREWREFPQVQA